VAAAVLSAAVKAWSSPHIAVLAVGLVGTLCIWRCVLSGRERDQGRDSDHDCDRMAEVDGNRTRRTGIARATRFEGGGRHQIARHLPATTGAASRRAQ